MSDLDEALLKSFGEDFPAAKRVKIPFQDADGRVGFMSASVPIDADMNCVIEEMNAVHKQLQEFDALSENDKLKYYLALAYKALEQIMNETGVDVSNVDFGNAQQKRLAMQLSKASCIADMAAIQIPMNYRTTNISI